MPLILIRSRQWFRRVVELKTGGRALLLCLQTSNARWMLIRSLYPVPRCAPPNVQTTFPTPTLTSSRLTFIRVLRQLKTESVPLVTVSHSAGQASSFRPRISLLSQQPLSIRDRDFQIARAGELPPSSYASQARRATLQSSASQVEFQSSLLMKFQTLNGEQHSTARALRRTLRCIVAQLDNRSLRLMVVSRNRRPHLRRSRRRHRQQHNPLGLPCRQPVARGVADLPSEMLLLLLNLDSSRALTADEP